MRSKQLQAPRKRDATLLHKYVVHPLHHAVILLPSPVPIHSDACTVTLLRLLPPHLLLLSHASSSTSIIETHLACLCACCAQSWLQPVQTRHSISTRHCGKQTGSRKRHDQLPRQLQGKPPLAA
jgi:hypothetical protein